MPQAGTLSPRRYYQKTAADSTPTGAPSATPPQIQAAMDQAGMNSRAYLGPGRPLQPAGGYSGRPRATDYPASVNVATQGRAAWGRPSYATLRAIIDAYDVARMCVNHKIDELRSMEPMFLPAKGVKEDVDDEIEVAELVLAYPDRELPYDSWLSKWLEGPVKFDSGPLYRRRDYNGDIIGLEVVDGTTIHPYIDENGRRPKAKPGGVAPPAFYQTVHGMVWQEFTTDDLVYVPFRPQDNSPYGLAPIESILLTANTDIRFQWHFLQMFTDGSIPAGFMELPPDVSSPAQVEEWQEYWDAMILGDQAKLGQLIAVPNGSKFTATKPAAFDKTFPQYLMMRTCAAFGVVPQDLGLIEDVNRSNGETQMDVQFRVNTLPWVRYVEGHLTRYLQHDLGLRVQIKLDTGRDKEDRLAEAQAHQLYVEMGAESPDEVRSEILGLPIDKERPTPRFVMVERVGPIPLLSIEGIAGKTDPDTHGPARDQMALDQPYVPPVGVIPTPGTSDDTAALSATDQMQISQRRQLEQQQGNTPVRESREQKHQRGAKAMKDDADAKSEASDEHDAVQPPSEQDAQDEQQQPAKPVAKRLLDLREAEELAAFRTFVTGRVRKGQWRDFAFYTLPAHIAAELNRGGRAEVTARVVAKAGVGAEASSTRPPKAAGIAVRAADTGRVLMLQRGLDPNDAASGTWEFPGGCLEEGEPATYAARREWEEEVGCLLPDGEQTGAWTSGNGVYAGHVWTVPSEHAIQIDDPRDRTLNPDDPGRDHVEAIAWWDPAQLTGNPAVRRELAADMPRVHQALKAPVSKAAGGPKAPGRSSSADDWPGWRYDQEAAAYWAPRISAAMLGAFSVEQLVAQFLGTHEDKNTKAEQVIALIAIARAWLASYTLRAQQALTPVMRGVYTDGYLIGAASGHAVLTGGGVELTPWTPGDADAAQLLLGQWGDGAGLRTLLAQSDVQIKSIVATRLDLLGQILGRGVAEGLTAEEIAGQIRDLLTNTSRALMIATTELSRAVAAAAENRYVRAGYGATRWLTEEDTKVCQICGANEERGAVAIGQPFPSGDLRPPAHPWCRCAPIPAYVEE